MTHSMNTTTLPQTCLTLITFYPAGGGPSVSSGCQSSQPSAIQVSIKDTRNNIDSK